MANKEFISQQARKRFEDPPQLSETERSSLFVIPPCTKLAIDQVPSSTNKAGFILQLGYFRLMGRFSILKPIPQKTMILLFKNFQATPNEVDIDEYKKYDLTLFKKIPESMENQEILKRVEMFIQIKAIYEQLLPVIKRLNLSHSTIRYYAEYVIDTQTA